jgi:hypothetical protein
MYRAVSGLGALKIWARFAPQFARSTTLSLVVALRGRGSLLGTVSGASTRGLDA